MKNTLSIPSPLRRFARQLVDRKTTLEDSLTDEKTFRQLIDFGVFHPYGDTFLYDERAVMICGDTGMGKTPLMKRLGKTFRGPLVEDIALLYWPGTNSRPLTYDFSAEYYPQLILDTILNPLISPEEYPSYELGAIILLRENEAREIGPVTLEGRKDLAQRFIETYEQAVDTKMQKLVDRVLSNVACFEYRKDYGYEDEEDLERTFKEVSTHLDRIMKQH